MQHEIRGEIDGADVPAVTRAHGYSRGTKLDIHSRETSMFRKSLLCVLGVALASCGPNQGRTEHSRSERERDSILGASQLPGARGVRGALGASDSAAARNARLDSIANER
jgi:hypothetical protein